MNTDRKNDSRISKNGRHVTGISWRLFGTLTLFVVLILIVIWVFQVVLLNHFYESSKLSEFYETDQQIFGCIEDPEALRAQVYSSSVDTDTCIRLFRVEDGVAKEVASSDVNVGCVLCYLKGEGLYKLYKSADENGGTYTQRLVNPSDSATAVSSIYVSVKTGSDGYQYVLMQDSELLPLGSTVSTLERQFGWIMCILIMGALIVALAISRVVCLPMERMSRSARMLAKGDYNAKFVGGGYREADELADALNYAAEELAKNDNLQKELVANISHDLRTPLTMIKGYSEVMRDIPGENTPENVQVIIDETERLTELVNDMLDLSKIRAGTRKPEPEVFDLTETVRAVMLRYEKFTEKKNFSIVFDATESVSVNADRTMVLQVIYNLVNNAINYTGDDGAVTITQSVFEGKVRISVADTGVGIAPEDLPYIWDRYYKVDKVHKRAVVGTGLGLSIVKGILESHGASYGVDSTPGIGSTFWFELDVAAGYTDAEFEEIE
ncbi:MAG: HAMP domain-containing histidine kinase [Clostridia bacterium]|nr:HAMP domain-containing histidine kinase [Clostridia bacterium]